MIPIVGEPIGPGAVPAAYEAAAKAKLKRDRDSYLAFREIDQRQHERDHERRVTAAVETWDQLRDHRCKRS